jgi:hypothetical protein
MPIGDETIDVECEVDDGDVSCRQRTTEVIEVGEDRQENTTTEELTTPSGNAFGESVSDRECRILAELYHRAELQDRDGLADEVEEIIAETRCNP